VLTTLKGLPLAYNRDLQEDKEPLFDAVDQIRLGLGALGGMLATTTFRTDRMATAADTPAAAATDLAELLVAGGMPFREAHGVVGGLVRRSLEEGLDLAALVSDEPSLGPEAAAVLEPGGAGPAPVAAQLVRFRDRLGQERFWLDALT
jgi:argininosuccinate lyase